jgi:hypothetical protein
MTGITRPIVVRIRNGQTEEISNQEMDTIVFEINKMFGGVVSNPKTFQDGLDRYCQHKGSYPLIIADLVT